MGEADGAVDQQTGRGASLKERGWLVAFVIVTVGIAGYLVLGPDSDHECSWLRGFKGNLVGEFVGNVLFLFLGFHLQRRVDKLQEEAVTMQRDMKDVQERMHAVQDEMKHVQRDMRLAQAETRDVVDSLSRHPSEQQAHLEFKRFLWRDSYHDVRLPEVKTALQPMGLQYTIAPIKDATGRPTSLRTEMHDFDLVMVQSIAPSAGDSADQLREYDSAAIHLNEAYFCEFYNGGWYLGQSAGSRRGQYRFELSTKFGQAEWTRPANEFLPWPLTPTDAVLFKTMLVSDDGTEHRVGGWDVRFYRQPDGSIWVQPSRAAPAKRVSMLVNELSGEHQLVIDSFEGYFCGDARPRFFALVEKVITEAGFKVPERYDWP